MLQTGSGKTYTMGTAFDMMDVMNEKDLGIVPRAIRHLFSGMDARRQQALDQGFVEPCFDIVAQFVEVFTLEMFLFSHLICSSFKYLLLGLKYFFFSCTMKI